MSSRLDELTAVIPVRKGSRRLRNKNLAPFGGSTLLEHKIAQLKSFLPSSNILVSSDSEEMLEIASHHGVRAHIRPAEYADDVEGKPLGETIGLLAEAAETEHILWAQVTSPLVDADLYLRAAKAYFEALEKGFDSLVSVQRVRDYLRDEHGPLNYNIGKGHLPSQFLPDVWKVTYGVIMAPKQKMSAWNYYYGESPLLLEVSKFEAVDIDDGEDLKIAQCLYNSRVGS